jgi:hypothetical protein
MNSGALPLDTDLQWSRMESLDNGIKKCSSCSTNFQWPKSQATLKMTYCSVQCEIRGLGFHIESFTRDGAYERAIKSEANTTKSVIDDDISGEDIDNIITALTQEEGTDDDDDGILV